MISATLSARSIAFAPTRMGICPHCGFACSEDACYACRTPPTRAKTTSTSMRTTPPLRPMAPPSPYRPPYPPPLDP